MKWGRSRRFGSWAAVDNTRQLVRQTIIDLESREVYEKLLRSLAIYLENNDTRLRYWQEVILRSVESQIGVPIHTFDQAIDLLLVCHVHNEAIAWTDGRKALGPEPTHSPEYLVAESKFFPHSQEIVLVTDHVAGNRATRVLSCPSCVEARRQWADQLPNNSFNPPARGSA